MIRFKDILFLPLEFPTPGDVDISKLDSIDYSEMFKDEYRHCYHINLVTSKLEPTRFLSLFPELNRWLKMSVLPVFRGRVMIIVTPPGERNPLHIDCSPQKFNTIQQKFRFVIQGNVSDLSFVTKNGVEHRPEETDKPFIMEGKWPHYMHNHSSKRKYTLAVGWPWEPNFQSEQYVTLIKKSIKVNSRLMLKTPPEEQLPEGWRELFEDKYMGGQVPKWHKFI